MAQHKEWYGFINRNDTRYDLFEHQSEIVKKNPPNSSVGDGEVVGLDVVVGGKRNEAKNRTCEGFTICSWQKVMLSWLIL